MGERGRWALASSLRFIGTAVITFVAGAAVIAFVLGEMLIRPIGTNPFRKRCQRGNGRRLPRWQSVYRDGSCDQFMEYGHEILQQCANALSNGLQDDM